MKLTYHIEGMTCNGCRTSVEKKLADVSGVSSAVVSLENKEAILEVSEEVSLMTIKNALPDKYIISEKGSLVNASAQAKHRPSKLQQLKPLFLIFTFITGASILIKYRVGVQSAMLDFMGLFYVVFSFFKFLDLRGFKNSFAMYDPLAKMIPGYGWIYPFIELGLGLLFLMRLQVEIALVVTIVILGVTTIGVTRTLLSKKEIQCACLGTALKLPMTEATFIENSIMIVMAGVMLLELI